MIPNHHSGHQAILPLPVAPLDVVNVQWLMHVPALLVVSTFGGLWGALFNRSRTLLWRRTRRTLCAMDALCMYDQQEQKERDNLPRGEPGTSGGGGGVGCPAERAGDVPAGAVAGAVQADARIMVCLSIDRIF